METDKDSSPSGLADDKHTCTRALRVAALRPQQGHVALPRVRWVVMGGWLRPHGSRGRRRGAARRAPARVRQSEPRLVTVAGRAQAGQILRSGPGRPVCTDVVCEVTANPAPVPAEPNARGCDLAQDRGRGPSPMKERGSPQAGAGCCAAGPQSAEEGQGAGAGWGWAAP